MTLTLWLQPSADPRENSMNPVCSHVTSDRHTFADTGLRRATAAYRTGTKDFNSGAISSLG